MQIHALFASPSTACQRQQRSQPPLSCVWSVCVSAAGAHAQKRMRKAVRGPDDALKQTAGGAQVGGKGWEGARILAVGCICGTWDPNLAVVYVSAPR